MTRRDRETLIHVAILHYLRAVLPDCVVAHVPNGGQRSAIAGARMKRLGTVPGMPDLMVLLPAGKVLFFEVKAPNGRPSETQRDL